MSINEEISEVIEWMTKLADANGYNKQECVIIMKLLHSLITRDEKK